LAEELERTLSVAKALGGDFRLNLHSQGYSTHNDPEIAAIVREVILGMLGKNQLLQTNPGETARHLCVAQDLKCNNNLSSYMI